MLKTLAFDTTAQLRRNNVPENPKTFLAALFTQLTMNSTLIVTCLFLAMIVPCALSEPLSDSPSSHMGANLWLNLAKVANVSHFCLSESYEMQSVLGDCILPVCKEPSQMFPHTRMGKMFSHHTHQQLVNYTNLHEWGTISKTLPLDTVALYTPNVASNSDTSCVRVVNCTQKGPHCLPTGKPTWNCSHVQNISFMFAHVLLPPGWFFTCNEKTYNYVPANLSDSQCCLSRLTLLLPDRSLFKKKGQMSSPSRIQRDSESLSDQCESNVQLFSKAEYVSLATSLVGLPSLAVYNARTGAQLACALAKTINHTSQALSLLNQEQKVLREAVITLKAAVDYLMLRDHLGCESVSGMCCFNLTDNSYHVQKQINNLQILAHNITENVLPTWWEGLWSWLPGVGWIRSWIMYGIMILAAVISTCCIIQCIPSLMSLSGALLHSLRGRFNNGALYVVQRNLDED